jgi:CubicO group peptidase (beta-lactamase class C family)
MLAVSLGESFLKRTLPEALGVSFADVAAPYPPDPEAIERWTWFAQTTIEDCLQHLSCFKRKAWSEVFDESRREIPLRPGDFTRALQQGGLTKLVVRPPRTYEEYNNWGYVAVGEAISRELRNGIASEYLEALQDWVTPALAQRIGFIPKTREDCLDAGEVPVRSRTCARRNTEVSRDTLKAAGVPTPPFAPGGYNFDDYDLWGPTGGLTMSLATYVRLLQLLHPKAASSELTGPRLRIDQVFRMLQRYPESVPNELSDGELEPTSFGLGAKVGLGRSPFAMSWGKPQRRPKPPQGAEWELTWGGDLSSGQSGFAHFVFPRPDGTDFLSNPDSLTVAWVTNNGQKLGSFVENLMVSDLRAGALAIQKQGGWDNDVDLFPELSLL